jgi:hypothetical protein
VAGGIADALGFGKYLRKDGRFSFQVDYGIPILNFACERAWPDRTRPEWMRKSDFIPCNCKKCFFCIKNLQSTEDGIHSTRQLANRSEGLHRQAS